MIVAVVTSWWYDTTDDNWCGYLSAVHMCNVYGETEKHEVLPLCPDERRFCIFSLTFSQDGREVLGGANDGCLYIYDCESRQRTLKVKYYPWQSKY